MCDSCCVIEFCQAHKMSVCIVLPRLFVLIVAIEKIRKQLTLKKTVVLINKSDLNEKQR